ncbi:MAG: xylulokinase [Fretibacterium sp.]|nr:xylulokinase [Fretibacterium sp.]
MSSDILTEGRYFMSVDLGTSSVRAFIADFEKKSFCSEAEGYDVIIPKTGYAEQAPQTWYEKTVLAIHRVLNKTGIDPKKIIAISFSGQMHGMVALDGDSNPVADAVIWMDQRSGEVLDEIYDIAGEKVILENTQNRIAAGFMIGTLYWFKTRRPQIYDQIQCVMMPKDYIKYRLCGAVTTDYSDAAGSLAFDNRRLCWASPVIKKLGIQETLLPKCGPSTQVVGHITAEAARETGLWEGTKVVNGGGDSFMQAVGNGIVSEGVFASNIGTAGQISATVRRPIFDAQGRMSTFAHVVPGCWHLMGACLNGGVALKWITRQVLGEEDYEAANLAAAQRPAGCGGLFFLPYLAGERTPHMDPKARGVFLGLTLNHNRADMERAVMEGVTFALKDCLSLLTETGARCDRIIAAGGGARSNLWLQIQADIFERDVYRSASKEQACLGAAITAAVGVGEFKDFDEACARCVDAPAPVFHPNAENAAIYRKAYPVFQDIYRQNRGIFAAIDAMARNG